MPFSFLMFSENLAKNPLRERADLQRAVVELWRPLQPFLAKDGAAVSLGVNAATYGSGAAAVETFVRPLWGVAALVAGGGEFAHGDLLRRVLAEGVDPANSRYWGALGNFDQRAVEMGSLAAALWLAPDLLWRPLSTSTQRHVVTWLAQINSRHLYDNNWLFFRLLVNGALLALGAGESSNEKRWKTDLQRLESFSLDGGWWSDGATRQVDYYVPMAMHFYGLFQTKLGGPTALLAEKSRERARCFAREFSTWFAPDGAAVPLGRSLAYRFAQGAFWGALAFAEVEALPWGEIKGLYLRHLRWWLRHPIFTETGLLSVGYGYPNQVMAEGYLAPGSPYWAMKAFLPLALPAEHPFWLAEESPVVAPPVTVSLGPARLLLCRDEARGHVFALANNPPHPARHRHTAEKYGKFVYSTAFAFGVPVGGSDARAGGGDSTLLLSLDGREWRAREEFAPGVKQDGVLHSRWEPWPGVNVETWLAPALPGHVRLHRIRSHRPLTCFEGGFALEKKSAFKSHRAAGAASAEHHDGFSGIWDLLADRSAQLVFPEPNTHLLFPLTIVPGLRGSIPPWESWLFTAVAGLPGTAQREAAQVWRKTLRAEIGDVPRIWQDGVPLIEARTRRF